LGVSIYGSYQESLPIGLYRRLKSDIILLSEYITITQQNVTVRCHINFFNRERSFLESKKVTGRLSESRETGETDGKPVLGCPREVRIIAIHVNSMRTYSIKLILVTQTTEQWFVC